MRLPEDIFKECAEIMGGKRHDYTAGPVHENFERSAEVASWFNGSYDKVYVTLIATKLARLATLLGNKVPRNESIRDTFKDLINYCALWADSRDTDQGAHYDSQQVHEEIAKSYIESTTNNDIFKLTVLCNHLTPNDINKLIEFAIRLDYERNLK